MIRNLLATTALATLVSMGAYAQEATTPAPAPADPAPMVQEAPAAAPVARADGHLASNIIGETVYNGTGDDAENIGEVNDIVIGKDGNIEAVVVGVGGFLGIGEKNVAVEYAELDWAEKDGDRWLVTPMTKEQLEGQVAFEPSAYDPEPATVAATDPAMAPADPAAPADPSVAAAPADPAAPAADETAQANPPADPAAPAVTGETTAAIDKSTLTELPATDIRAEDMIGTTVYGAGDVNVGEIGDVAMSTDGKVDAYIIDVGGFLGVGEKEVAVGVDNLAFMTDKDGNKYLYTSFSKEQLDAAAAYDKATYVEKRDDQRLMMQ